MCEQKKNAGLPAYERRHTPVDRKQGDRVYITKQALALVARATEATGELWGYARPEERLYQIQSIREQRPPRNT